MWAQGTLVVVVGAVANRALSGAWRALSLLDAERKRQGQNDPGITKRKAR